MGWLAKFLCLIFGHNWVTEGVHEVHAFVEFHHCADCGKLRLQSVRQRSRYLVYNGKRTQYLESTHGD